MFFYKLICRCVGLYNIIPNRLFAAEAKSLLNMSAIGDYKAMFNQRLIWSSY